MASQYVTPVSSQAVRIALVFQLRWYYIQNRDGEEDKILKFVKENMHHHTLI
jgi:hypothetical protein